MPGSDRLEEASASVPSEGEVTTPETTGAAPKKSTRARRPRTSEPAEGEAAVTEKSEAATPEAEAVPKRSTRARRPRASEPAEGEAAVTEKSEAAAPEAEAAPKKSTRARQPRAAAPEAETPAAETAPRPRRATGRRPVAEEAPSEAPPQVKRLPRLLERYRSQIKETLREEFGYQNVMQIPRLEKVVLNIGLSETKTNPKAMESATRDLTLIAAQKPVITRARRSIAGFKLREGDPIGTAVTLRGNRMYHFMDRLLNAALPRIRDFRGVSRTAFDGRGNYSLGIREQVIFPEIDYSQIDRIRGLQISIITTASTDREAMRLLDLLGMPFTRETDRGRE